MAQKEIPHYLLVCQCGGLGGPTKCFKAITTDISVAEYWVREAKDMHQREGGEHEYWRLNKTELTKVCDWLSLFDSLEAYKVNEKLFHGYGSGLKKGETR